MVDMVRRSKKSEEMLWDMMVEDVQAAADVFRPVYDKTKGADGFVSIEVGPTIATNTRRTITFAEFLHDRCRRPNVMVKIPATKEGLPAIEDQISKGHNINITLIFSVDRYVEVVIGPETVNASPPATLAAFREHGEVRRSIDENVELAKRQLKQLADAGVDLDQVTRELEVEGVDAFIKSFESLVDTIRKEAQKIKAGKGPRQWYSLGALQPKVDARIASLQKEDAPRRLWAKDSTLWSSDPAKREEIRDRLGWLSVAEKMAERESEFKQLARDGRTYSDVVLLGMGGSRLCPDVLRNTFGSAKGRPKLHVLDTTDPTTIIGVRKKIRIKDTLFIVASKSGETTETLSHFAYFWDQVSAEGGAGAPGRHFAAITDPGTSLEKLARDHGFRWIFRNPPDIGGRHPGRSHFGIVPGALLPRAL